MKPKILLMEQYIEGKDGKERSFRVAVEPGYGG